MKLKKLLENYCKLNNFDTALDSALSLLAVHVRNSSVSSLIFTLSPFTQQATTVSKCLKFKSHASKNSEPKFPRAMRMRPLLEDWEANELLDVEIVNSPSEKQLELMYELVM